MLDEGSPVLLLGALGAEDEGLPEDAGQLPLLTLPQHARVFIPVINFHMLMGMNGIQNNLHTVQ